VREPFSGERCRSSKRSRNREPHDCARAVPPNTALSVRYKILVLSKARCYSSEFVGSRRRGTERKGALLVGEGGSAEEFGMTDLENANVTSIAGMRSSRTTIFPSNLAVLLRRISILPNTTGLTLTVVVDCCTRM
jgi:hypothetical protein